MHRFIGIIAFAWAAAAQAEDAQHHQLAVHMPDGARWTQTVTSSTTNSQNIFRNAASSTETFSNTLTLRDGGYVISRQLTDRRDESDGGDADLNRIYADMADITNAQAELYSRLEYDADANLLPVRVDNWDDIQQRQYDLNVKTYGKDMADGIKDDGSNAFTAETAPEVFLNLEILMNRVHREALAVGVPQSEADTLDGLTDPIAATSTLTLTRWNDDAGEADYTLVTGVDEAAGKAAVFNYLLDFLYPLNTMDEGQAEQLKQTARKMSDEARLVDERTCIFTAAVATGLVTRMTCDSKFDLAAEVGATSGSGHVEVVQTPTP